MSPTFTPSDFNPTESTPHLDLAMIPTLQEDLMRPVTTPKKQQKKKSEAPQTPRIKVSQPPAQQDEDGAPRLHIKREAYLDENGKLCFREVEMPPETPAAPAPRSASVPGVDVYIRLGNQYLDQEASKRQLMNVLFRFYYLSMGLKAEAGDYSYRIKNIPSTPLGDPAWMQDRVFDMVNIHGAQSDEEAIQKARTLYAVYTQTPGHEGKMGLNVVLSQLSAHYIDYDVYQ